MKISEELAELCGIIAGDGHIHIDTKNGDYRIDISGDYKEIKYHKYICKLFKELFGKEAKIDFKKDGIITRIHSKEIVKIITKIGIPSGKKSQIIKMPKLIPNNLKLAFLRGFADTDFSVCFKKGDRNRHSYPVISTSVSSIKIIKDIKKILDNLGIKYYQGKRIKKTNYGSTLQYDLDINGKKNLKIWMENIGFKNSKHLDKIEFWKKYGYYQKEGTKSG